MLKNKLFPPLAKSIFVGFFSTYLLFAFVAWDITWFPMEKDADGLFIRTIYMILFSSVCAIHFDESRKIKNKESV